MSEPQIVCAGCGKPCGIFHPLCGECQKLLDTLVVPAIAERAQEGLK